MTNPTGLYKVTADLGRAVAFVAALIGTPWVFNYTKKPLFIMFAEAWGNRAAEILVWISAAVEAYLIFQTVSFVITASMVWLLTAMAERQFRE